MRFAVHEVSKSYVNTTSHKYVAKTKSQQREELHSLKVQWATPGFASLSISLLNQSRNANDILWEKRNSIPVPIRRQVRKLRTCDAPIYPKNQFPSLDRNYHFERSNFKNFDKTLKVVKEVRKFMVKSKKKPRTAKKEVYSIWYIKYSI